MACLLPVYLTLPIILSGHSSCRSFCLLTDSNYMENAINTNDKLCHFADVIGNKLLDFLSENGVKITQE